jgi:hypothetical protein
MSVSSPVGDAANPFPLELASGPHGESPGQAGMLQIGSATMTLAATWGT